MRHLVRLAGIGRQDDRDAAVGRRACAPSAIQPSIRAAIAAIRSGSARCSRRANSQIADRARAASLKLATPAKSRPSTSGRTTCIARSAGDRPRAAPAQAARSEVASAIWKTGTSGAVERRRRRRSPRAEKAVALTIAAGASAATQRRSQPLASPGLERGREQADARRTRARSARRAAPRSGRGPRRSDRSGRRRSGCAAASRSARMRPGRSRRRPAASRRRRRSRATPATGPA